MEIYGSKTVPWFQRTLSFITRSWTRLTAHGILSSGNQQNASGFEEEFFGGQE
jgi:hypothetical protein